ncbi:hypothetical protein RCL_jg13885.t1 [Rhizophagus clarus]|uniref:Uncharacterized protein n=1 Tax=Rhizophagus clarus TaxID=94130 RepID=A0A8H3QTS3_9GLOM|nr:hypothetical protein RCL_jg13885.t1 [Rhizophagus clarus]
MTCLTDNLAGHRVAANELHSPAICFLTKSREPLILNQMPKKRKEEVTEIGVTDIKGIRFKEDKDKLNSTGEIVDVVVKDNIYSNLALVEEIRVESSIKTKLLIARLEASFRTVRRSVGDRKI